MASPTQFKVYRAAEMAAQFKFLVHAVEFIEREDSRMRPSCSIKFFGKVIYSDHKAISGLSILDTALIYLKRVRSTYE